MAELYERLEELRESDFYPFHMPGHKRNMTGHPLEEVFGIDITEIDGFDNLHHPEDLLKRMQQDAATIYQVDETFFLVNGSTCGLQAAISATITKGKKLLMARNCHKAAYNTCYIREIDISYLYPQETEHPMIYGSISPKDVEDKLKEDPTIGAVLVTSPNYDGVLSDIKKIAELAHKYGVILIVDEAHGAHLPFASLFPQSAISCGADLVVQSLHKTLPSMTQTALLHVQGERVNRERLRQFLSIYQTSSPSYVFMATMQQCIENVYKNRVWLFQELSDRIDGFLENTANLKHLRVLSREWAKHNGVYNFDKCKILVSTEKCILNGEQIYEILLKQYHLQMEMASKDYVLGIATVCDSEEGFLRLEKALKEIDSLCEQGMDVITKRFPFIEKQELSCMEYITESHFLFKERIEETKVFPIYIACEMEKEQMELNAAVGKVSGEFVYLYPPGVPMIVPGERITEEMVSFWRQCMKMGLPLQGMQDYTCKTIIVLK